jgi:hypothetical protein
MGRGLRDQSRSEGPGCQQPGEGYRGPHFVLHKGPVPPNGVRSGPPPGASGHPLRPRNKRSTPTFSI